jgi:sucrose-phosphate synthase
MGTNYKGIVISDLDNTLVFSLGEGNPYFVSRQVGDHIDQLRRIVPFGILTGSRLSSYEKKINGNVNPDIVMVENGSYIYSKKKDGSLQLDDLWREHISHNLAELKSFSDELSDELVTKLGIKHKIEWKNSMFLLNKSILPDEISEELRSRNINGVTIRYNNGHIEFFSSAAGKDNAVRYLSNRYSVPLESFAMLGDGDNDSDVMKIVGVPITHIGGTDAVKSIVSSNSKGYISPYNGIQAAIDMLTYIKIFYEKMN